MAFEMSNTDKFVEANRINPKQVRETVLPSNWAKGNEALGFTIAEDRCKPCTLGPIPVRNMNGWRDEFRAANRACLE